MRDATGRRRYLDWMRGIAVLIMIQAHVLDSWTRLDVRGSWQFRWAMIVAGFGAPMFLFLAGVSVVLSAGSKMRRTGDSRAAASAVIEAWRLDLFSRVHLQAPGVDAGLGAARLAAQSRHPQRDGAVDRRGGCALGCGSHVRPAAGGICGIGHRHLARHTDRARDTFARRDCPIRSRPTSGRCADCRPSVSSRGRDSFSPVRLPASCSRAHATRDRESRLNAWLGAGGCGTRRRSLCGVLSPDALCPLGILGRLAGVLCPARWHPHADHSVCLCVGAPGRAGIVESH